jgi:hypothetical protein
VKKAKKTLKDVDGQLGTSVVSEQNYLDQPKQKQIEQSSLFDELGEEQVSPNDK